MHSSHSPVSLLAFQAFGHELLEAQEWCKKYQRTQNVKELTKAWDSYYHVFRRISKQLPLVCEYLNDTNFGMSI